MRLEEITITQLHEAYVGGETTCEAVTREYLRRIEVLDTKGSRLGLNSVTTTAPRALEEARAADEYLRQHGKLQGSMHGVPVLVKDQIETADMVTMFGNECFRDYVPARDAELVTRLKQAGAIVIGKTTVPDFFVSWFGNSSASVYTKNPYDPARDPGGSSSGSAAAVAANLCTVAVGEDTGGSIRLPASFCNLVGLRTTPGVVPRDGVCPLIRFQDAPGALTRTVRDTAIMLDAMAGYHASDPFTMAANIVAAAAPGGSFTTALDRSTLSLKGLRLGVVREAFGSYPESQASAAVAEAMLDTLQAHGAVCVPVTIRDLERFKVDTSLYAMNSRSEINRFFSGRNVQVKTLDEIVRSGRYDKYHLDLLADMVRMGPDEPLESLEFNRKLACCQEFAQVVGGVICDNKLDALVYPDVQVPAPTTADVYSTKWDNKLFPTNTLIASQCRFPALSMPAGFTRDSNMPVGLEFVGLPYSDARLLEIGQAVERVAPHRRAPDFAQYMD